MTYAQHRGLGAIPSGWDGWPLPVRVVDIRVRAASVRALVGAMSQAIQRAAPDFQVDDPTSVMSLIKGLARASVRSSVPVQAAKSALIVGMAQMDRLAVSALAAADAVLADRTNPNSAIKSQQTVDRLLLAAQALSLAEQIQGAVLRIFNALHPQTGTSGFGDVESAAYAFAIGALFGPATAGFTFVAGSLVALVLLCEEADGIVGRIASAIGESVSAIAKTVGEVVNEVARGAGRGIGDWLKYTLLGLTAVGVVYYGVPLLTSKMASSRAR